jgi:Tol biopolymer transport system component
VMLGRCIVRVTTQGFVFMVLSFALPIAGVASPTHAHQKVMSRHRHPRIVYVTERAVDRIESIRPSGIGRRTLVGHLGFPEAQLSPNGRSVAYVDNHQDVIVMNIDGTHHIRLSAGNFDRTYDSFPAWSPDGAKIAFQRGANDCGVKVIVKSLDGSSRVVVTRDSSGYEGAEPPRWPVSWSADGSRISYFRYNGCPRNVVTHHRPDSATGSHKVTVTRNADHSQWSPVGQRLAYTTGSLETPPSKRMLVVSREDGSHRTVVTHHFAPFFEWSPKGHRIVYSTGGGYTSLLGGQRCGALYVARADGRNRRRITPRGLCTGDVAWSPSGGSVAFAGKLDGAQSADWELYRVRPDRSHLKRLTSSPRIVTDVDW